MVKEVKDDLVGGVWFLHAVIAVIVKETQQWKKIKKEQTITTIRKIIFTQLCLYKFMVSG